LKRIALALLGAVSLSACAQSPAPVTAATPGAQARKPAAAERAATPVPNTPEGRARAAILKLSPKAIVDHVGPAALPGFQEAIVAGQVVYITDDGRYLMQGSLYDIAARRDMGEASLSKLRQKLLAAVPASQRIVFAPANPVHTVTIFTDVECGYCRKLHGEIADYNKQGIAVEYLAFPRMGLGSEDFKTMVGVWCAPDRRRALTDAKLDRRITAGTCKNPVTAHYDLGQRVGVTGTPAIFAANGTLMGGYLPPAQLREKLDKLAAPATTADSAP